MKKKKTPTIMSKTKQIERMKELGMLFIGLHEAEEDAGVDMNEPRVKHTYHCGTVACHAGWFVIAHHESRDIEELKWEVNYEKGVEAMNKFLGIRNPEHDNLSYYMDKHPQVWGNQNGGHMFNSKKAFVRYSRLGKVCREDEEKHRNFSLKVIGEHWLQVAERYELSDVRFN